MALMSTSSTTEQQRLVPHMPRLSYRSVSSETTSTQESIRSCSTISTAPTSPGLSEYCPSPRSARLPPGTLVPNPTPATPPGTPPNKKQGGSLLRFFSVKEPSTQAFEDYQQQMLKSKASQNSRGTAFCMPGVSSAQLPPTVPKVNSKWDGVPQVVKEREKEKDVAVQQSISGYTRSVKSSKSDGPHSRSSSRGGSYGGIGHRSNGKLSFNSGSGNLSDMYGWENGSNPTGSGAKDSGIEKKASTPSKVPENTYFFPHPRSYSITIPEEFPQDLAVSPHQRVSPAPMPASSLPLAPSPTPSLMTSISRPKQERHLTDVLQRTTLEIPTNVEEFMLKSTGINILGPPISAKRRPKASPFQAGEATEMELPKDEVTAHPTPRKSSTTRGVGSHHRPSLSTHITKLDPGVWSQRPSSARGNLGFGGIGTDHIAVPRDSPDSATANSRQNISPSSQGGPKLRRVNRMSFFGK